MTDAETRRDRAARLPQSSSWREATVHRLFGAFRQLSRRAIRSALFRLSNVLSTERRAALKRRMLFPFRNAVLRHRPLEVTAGGQHYLLTPQGNVAQDIWTRHHFEKHELDFILSTLAPGMTFVDVGANVGLFSIPAAKKVQHGNVYAFEPAPWTFERLTENARLNSVLNLLPVRSALGDYTGEAVLQVNTFGKDGLNTIGKPTHEYSDVVGTERVPITTLDDFIQQHPISHVDVIKVDVEGAELLVFRGAENLLARSDAPLILYEGGYLSKGFGYHPVETMWLLERHGYSCFVIDSRTGQVSIPPAKRAYNAMVIAVKPTHPLYPTVNGAAR